MTTLEDDIEGALEAFANDDSDGEWNESSITITDSPEKTANGYDKNNDTSNSDETTNNSSLRDMSFQLEDDLDTMDLLNACEEAEQSMKVEKVNDWDEGIPKPSEKHLEVLQKAFGHGNFRPHQWKIIYNILNEKKDQCVVMATGYGKSLCYQYPPVFTGGLSIVISPLISLMTDQVLALQMSNISACFLGSAQDKTGEIVTKLRNREYRVIYMSPEFCDGDYGSNLLDEMYKNLDVTLVAIDEAHCVSHWGHDFRSSYMKLGSLKKKFFDVPFLALTATATPRAKLDICSALRLRSPAMISTSFDRPNLYLSVSKCSPSVMSDMKKLMAEREDGTWEFEGSTIIYCPTKKKTEEVALALKGNDVECVVYHAGMSPKLRREAHELFVRDKVQVVVATIAFGMGIDKPDVRNVIHYGAPRDIESYYQEIGRAGRDGLPAHCQVFYELRDFNVHRHFLTEIRAEKYRQYRQEMIQNMEKYLSSRQCRRNQILSHFENENFTAQPMKGKGNTRCCDNCTWKIIQPEKDSAADDADSYKDYTREGELLLRAIQLFGGRKGMNASILVLRGSKGNNVAEYLWKNDLHGAGKHQSEAWWKAFGKQLVHEGYLTETSKSTSSFSWLAISVSGKGEKFLHECRNKKGSLKLIPNADIEKATPVHAPKTHAARNATTTASAAPKTLPQVAVNLWESYVDDNSSNRHIAFETAEKQVSQLYQELIKVRNDLARDYDCMPYMVANNKVLVQLAKIRPSTTEKLIKVGGFVQAKVEKFGIPMLKFIKNWCEKNQVSLDGTDKELQPSLDKAILEKTNCLSPSQRECYMMFHLHKKDIEDISRERHCVRSTVLTYLLEAIKIGLPLSVNRLGVTQEVMQIVEKGIRSPPVNSDISRLTPIKDNCPLSITWDQIKIVVAILTWKYGLGNHQFLPDNQPSTSTRITAPIASENKSPKKLQQTTLIAHLSPKKKIESNTAVSKGDSGEEKAKATGSKTALGKYWVPLDDEDDSTEVKRQTNAENKRKLPGWLLGAKSPSTAKVQNKKLKLNF